MKTKTILVLLFTCLLSLSYSQNYWEPLYFPDTAADIRCFSTNDEGHLFVGTTGSAYGEYGALYRSIDTALTWDIVFDAGTNSINNVAVNDSGFIYISKQTAYDRFFVSKNNCTSWEQITLPPLSTGNITSLVTYGNDTIYLSSWEWDAGGLLLRSIDGGENWDSLFSCLEPNSYISDISVSGSGKIYVSTLGFFYNSGGVYVSEDNGLTWSLQGLFNHQVRALAINSNSEVFAGDWYTVNSDPPGLFALYDGSTQFELLKYAYQVTDIAINSENVLFVAEDGNILRSEDNGQSFEDISFGATGSTMLHIDNNEYLFAVRSTGISRSNQSTITFVDDYEYYNHRKGFTVYPNPADDIINIKRLFIIPKSNYKNTRICIYNSQGSLLYNSEYTIDPQISLNISFLQSGVYFLKLTNEKVSEVNTIIIK